MAEVEDSDIPAAGSVVAVAIRKVVGTRKAVGIPKVAAAIRKVAVADIRMEVRSRLSR